MLGAVTFPHWLKPGVLSSNCTGWLLKIHDIKKMLAAEMGSNFGNDECKAGIWHG